jgi:hypothetical protein
MNSFTLLYLFYSAKLGSQASIYFIWLVDSSSGTIAFIAAAVAIFAIFPFFHVIVHIFSAKPLSSPTFIAYLCFRWVSISPMKISLLIYALSFLFAILWYEPTQDREQRVLPFAVVTTFDLLALLIFLFQRQIGRWHDILTSDIEQGHVRAGGLDGESATLVSQGNEQVEHRDVSARPETPRSEIRRRQVMQELGYDINAINRSGRDVGSSITRPNPRSVDGRSGGGRLSSRIGADEASGRFTGADVAMQRPESVGWTTRTLQPLREPQEMDDGPADLERDPPERPGEFFISLGMDAGASRFGDIHSPRPVRTPDTIIPINIHPAYRPTFNTSRSESHDGFRTPKEAPGMTSYELNQI